MESKFYTWNKRGSKMIIESDFKEFNKQTNAISAGNVLANTQYSNIIRPYNETKCNGLEFPQGHLHNYDLKYFSIDYHMKKYIEKLNKRIILYEFFIYKRNGQKDIIGWLIEDNGKIINLIVNHYHANYLKRYSALDTARNIIEEQEKKYY